MDVEGRSEGFALFLFGAIHAWRGSTDAPVDRAGVRIPVDPRHAWMNTRTACALQIMRLRPLSVPLRIENSARVTLRTALLWIVGCDSSSTR